LTIPGDANLSLAETCENQVAVIENPYVTRFVGECGAQVVLLNQRKQIGQEHW
jgi:hypothetical protein